MPKETSCGLLIKQIHDELEKQANNNLREQDLTMAQVGALLKLNECPEKQMSLKELERLLHVAQSTAAGIVSRLEQKGLVEGLVNPDDKRSKLVRITERGARCCFEADQSMEKAEAELLGSLTETEREIFRSLLLKACRTAK